MSASTSTPSATTTTSATRLNPLAVAGFVVALVGLVLFFTGWFGALVAVVGGVLSIVGRSQLRRRGERGNGLAVAGIILGVLGLIAGVADLVLVLAVVLPQLQHMR